MNDVYLQCFIFKSRKDNTNVTQLLTRRAKRYWNVYKYSFKTHLCFI